MAGLVDLENAFNPGNDLMRRGVGWLVKVDDTVALELSQWSGCWRPPARKRGEVVSLHVELVEVL